MIECDGVVSTRPPPTTSHGRCTVRLTSSKANVRRTAVEWVNATPASQPIRQRPHDHAKSNGNSAQREPVQRSNAQAEIDARVRRPISRNIHQHSRPRTILDQNDRGQVTRCIVLGNQLLVVLDSAHDNSVVGVVICNQMNCIGVVRKQAGNETHQELVETANYKMSHRWWGVEIADSAMQTSTADHAFTYPSRCTYCTPRRRGAWTVEPCLQVAETVVSRAATAARSQWPALLSLPCAGKPSRKHTSVDVFADVYVEVYVEVFRTTHRNFRNLQPVSYTHLTLPTIYSV